MDIKKHEITMRVCSELIFDLKIPSRYLVKHLQENRYNNIYLYSCYSDDMMKKLGFDIVNVDQNEVEYEFERQLDRGKELIIDCSIYYEVQSLLLKF